MWYCFEKWNENEGGMKVLILCVVLVCLVVVVDVVCFDIFLMYNVVCGWIVGQCVFDLLVCNMEDVNCVYVSFCVIFEVELGLLVGVKVVFILVGVQQVYGIFELMVGVLFVLMLVGDGSRISLKGSCNLLYEVDLVVMVGNFVIMCVCMCEDVVVNLCDVCFFIELFDIVLLCGVQLIGLLLVSYGVMLWCGVLGQGIVIFEFVDFVVDLVGLILVLWVDGQVVYIVCGDSLLDYLLDVVLWLVMCGNYDLKVGLIILLGLLGIFGFVQFGWWIEVEYIVGGWVMKVGVMLVL